LTETKHFPGGVLTGAADLPRIQRLDDAFALQAADPVVFVTERRYYVYRNRVVGLAHYRGDCFIVPDGPGFRRAVAEYTTAPVACALDFGVASDGRTLLIEVNDAFALGAYGLDSVVYADMLEARWLQMVGGPTVPDSRP